MDAKKKAEISLIMLQQVGEYPNKKGRKLSEMLERTSDEFICKKTKQCSKDKSLLTVKL